MLRKELQHPQILIFTELNSHGYQGMTVSLKEKGPGLLSLGLKESGATCALIEDGPWEYLVAELNLKSVLPNDS